MIGQRHLIVRSRNHSCAPLRLINVDVPVIYRMGSTTPTDRIFRTRYARTHCIEINSAKACEISGDKILMKKRFSHARIKSAPWFMVKKGDSYGERFLHYLNIWETNIIVKRKNSSGGNGIYLLTNHDDYKKFYREHKNDIENYIFERYYTYTKEYRIHVTKFGCFYTSRKMLITNAEDRWHRHHNNSTFINEENPMFEKPENWDEIVTECQNALKCLGLQIAAFDVKVSKKGKFIILESNSAPALGEQGIDKYTVELKKIIEDERNRYVALQRNL